MGWDTSAIGDLTGRRALITGATSGIGTETARELLRHGAEVVITARDDRKAAATVAQLGDIEVVSLDLADLPGTIAAAQGVVDAGRGFDIVVNNAGVMIPPFTRTMDGFELQMATNHLGHFAWTATLWPLLREGSTRIVTVSSLAHSMTKELDLRSLEPNGDPRRYKKWRSYAESKLANLLFMKELDRRVKAAGLDVVSVAAHPGLSSTNLTKPSGIAIHSLATAFLQPARAGAWPSLRAATDPSLTGGEYLGPDGFRQTRGRPRLVGMTPAARDPELAAEVWSASETATGVVFKVA
ncbi:oxidoreductase [Aeromicrobium duanguangcaii]|uniref:Oxidoreductase n=1 Tax=Aeromicrobium duanguangcaii TaxID=2968086 RepID=A0ABY5KE78_9ACTN|nr:oxidoreductase [Aeromicrobium duanguangcaii]MCD9155390.1 SDR family NAD(P)-dependent oxidoreductase [Aeromicrobium duanguangcaii]MCL3838358.1 oxidoreductase [Aeromicrobium duanguangcaii]UUI68338.1 oxidoreductase [Aeromicrobium duanguangcaii]